MAEMIPATVPSHADTAENVPSFYLISIVYELMTIPVPPVEGAVQLTA